MGFFDMLFGRKKIVVSSGADLAKMRDDLRRELLSEISKENDVLRQDIAIELGKIHRLIEESGNSDEIKTNNEKIAQLRAALNDLSTKFSDLAVLGRLSIDNKERLDKYASRLVTKEDLEALRYEILNLNAVASQSQAEELPAPISQPEPKAPLSHILESLPKSRRVLVDILMHAENPISYRQIATTMGLTYNTVKVYIRDIREAGFPIEEYITQNKKLLNIPNSVKATLLYGGRQ